MSFHFSSADLSLYDTNREDVDAILQNPEFKKDPIFGIVAKMVSRGAGKYCLSDRATALVLGRVIKLLIA